MITPTITTLTPDSPMTTRILDHLAKRTRFLHHCRFGILDTGEIDGPRVATDLSDATEWYEDDITGQELFDLGFRLAELVASDSQFPQLQDTTVDGHRCLGRRIAGIVSVPTWDGFLRESSTGDIRRVLFLVTAVTPIDDFEIGDNDATAKMVERRIDQLVGHHHKEATAARQAAARQAAAARRAG